MDQELLKLIREMDLTIGFSNSKNGFPASKMEFLLPKADAHLLNTILRVDIGEPSNSFNSSSLNANYLEKLSGLFDHVKKRHYKIIYKNEFQSREMVQKNYFERCKKGSNNVYAIEEKKCEQQVHPAQIQEGIRTICYKLLPPEIIGHKKNNVKIVKAWNDFVRNAQTEPYSLFNLVTSLNIESMAWLHFTDDKRLKSILIGKFIKWLFVFLITIVEKEYHVTHIQGQIVFISTEDWKIQKENYLKLMCQRAKFQLVGRVNEDTEIQSRLHLIPKPDGLRPITVHSFTDDENHKLKLLKGLLKHLYKKDYKSFNRNFANILKDYKSNNGEIYIVSCDISDAYGSILQGKLFEIVQKMFEPLPAKIKFTTETIRKKKYYRVITEDTNPMSFHANNCETAEKHVLMQALKNHIYQTKIVHKKELYNMNRGITHGLPISSILCLIYYANMDMKYFAHLEEHGHLFKYIDDYLYVTNEFDSAKRFLDIVEKGIPEYNCSFKKSKLQHNLTPNCSEKIKYLGWNLDSKSLEVAPTYNSTRYSLYFNGLSLRTLIFKLKNPASLKLERRIFSKHINSREKILQNVALVSRRQAERCFALLSCLHEFYQQKVPIDPIIKANKWMLRKIQRLTAWSDCESRQNWKNLKIIVWKNFYTVFTKRNDRFSYLTEEFEDLMKRKRVNR